MTSWLKKMTFLHLVPPYYNISYTCLFVYLNFPPFSEIFQCLNAIVFIHMLLRNISNLLNDPRRWDHLLCHLYKALLYVHDIELVEIGVWWRMSLCFRGAGKARFNVATPTNATVTCTAYVLPYNLQTKSI